MPCSVKVYTADSGWSVCTSVECCMLGGSGRVCCVRRADNERRSASAARFLGGRRRFDGIGEVDHTMREGLLVGERELGAAAILEEPLALA